MAGMVETELKLALVQTDNWRDILTWPGWRELAKDAEWQQEILEAQYYDTADYDLRRAKMAYRIRRENGKWVAAVKGGGSSEGGLHRRNEWEVGIEEPIPCIRCFDRTDVGETLNLVVADKPLQSLFTTCFERYKLLVKPDEATVIEVALDRGAILAGKLQAPIQEIELELKRGSVTALLALGARLAAAFPLLFEDKSKYYRGLLLAGLTEKNAKQREQPLNGSQAVTTGARELVRRSMMAALREYTKNRENLSDPEALHQMRIKFRRLRAAISFVKPLVIPDQYTQMQDMLREMGRLLGPARELDVVMEAWEQVQSSTNLAAGHSWLADMLAAERAQIIAGLENVFTERQVTSMFLRLWTWLEDDIWLEPPAQVFRSFCAARLDQWYRELIDFGKKPAMEDIATLHKLRIAGKKLRYVLERLDGVLGSPMDDLLDRLKQLQDSLGELRDARQAAAVLSRLMADKSSRALHREAGILMGWQARGAVEKQKGAIKAWRRVRRRVLKHTKGVYD